MPRDDDDDYAPRRGAAFPAGVKTAGVIWIAYGVLGLIGVAAVMAIAMSVVNRLPPPAGANANPAAAAAGMAGGALCVSGCLAIFPAAFLFIGIQTVRGTAPGTMGNGVGSIVFALLHLARGVAGLVMADDVARRMGGPAPGTADYALSAYAVVLGLMLLAAGVMAIGGKDAYLDWREENGMNRRKSRRRPRRDEEDDDRDDRDDRDDDRRPRRRDRDEDE